MLHEDEDAGAAALDIDGLTVHRGIRSALNEIDLVVRAGELVILVGENGAGKTTLVESIAGLTARTDGNITSYGIASEVACAQRSVAIVWQDLGLCDNLTVAENLFLGREIGGLAMNRRRMRAETVATFEQFGWKDIDPNRSVGALSGGERQLLAIARALSFHPDLLILDEPTSALGVSETRMVLRAVGRLKRMGCAVLLVSHQVEEAMAHADRVVIMRHGRIVGDMSPVGLQLGDVVELMSGVSVESVARRNLTQLSSLLEQLALRDPSVALPAIVSGFSVAAGQQQLSVHLMTNDSRKSFSLAASVGLSEQSREQLAAVDVESDHCISRAALTCRAVVVDDLARELWWTGPGDAPLSMWAVPMHSDGVVYGVLAGYADTLGRPREDHLQLAGLYAGLAASSLERDALLERFALRNRVLEGLREVLDVLAGPELLDNGFAVAIPALRRALRCDALGLIQIDPSTGSRTSFGDGTRTNVGLRLNTILDDALSSSPDFGSQNALLIDGESLCVPFETRGHHFLLGALWSPPHEIPGKESRELLEGAARSFRLAVEREFAETARTESAALRRTADLQREFTYRLSHELRTPLTAITGYASTLTATDVVWGVDDQSRFISAISIEASRMQRLVGDLLDLSAIEAGSFRLRMDWCDLPTIVEVAGMSMLVRGFSLETTIESATPPIWADHERLQQVMVNIFDNAAKHGAAPVRAHVSATEGWITIDVSDNGPGVASSDVVNVFDPYVRLGDEPGAGLGLAICRSIVEAHGGLIRLVPQSRGTLVRIELPIRGDERIEA